MVDHQCRLKCGDAGASAGKTKLELAAQEALASWKQQAVKGEMERATEFIEILNARVETFPSKL